MGSPLNTLSNHLAQVLSFGPDERDLLLMRHEVTIRWPDRRRELRGINLVVYGDVAEDKADSGESTVVKPCYTAMAKCVGFPAGIAAKMILDKEIQKRGMVYPFSADIYKPMLMRLANEGIVAKEKSRFI
jgi:alpha-aminoadipic semialdehyde synthase